MCPRNDWNKNEPICKIPRFYFHCENHTTEQIGSQEESGGNGGMSARMIVNRGILSSLRLVIPPRCLKYGRGGEGRARTIFKSVSFEDTVSAFHHTPIKLVAEAGVEPARN